MRNRFKVPKKQWQKWSTLAQAVFNQTFAIMTLNQKLFLHPEDTKRPKKYWRTTAYNAAWTAAEATKEHTQ